MDSKLHIAFKKISDNAIPNQLAGRILKKIDEEATRRARRRLVVARFGLAGSFGLLVGVVHEFGNALVRSEFWDVASLLLSDIGIVLSHGGTFFYSLLETFPALEITALMLPVFTLLLSLNFSSRAVRGQRYSYI